MKIYFFTTSIRYTTSAHPTVSAVIYRNLSNRNPDHLSGLQKERDIVR